MERDVNTCMQRGAKREDVIAGLAYSVVYNYINRVVRGRVIGDCIFFQGGTAYNDAVASAFSAVTGKEIIVPPHNVVLGAIGAALLAKEKASASGYETRFRGYDMSKVDYKLREFSCKGCGNECSVQEFNVEGEKTFWGDKCSDRFRKQAKSDRKALIPDLVALRKELQAADDDGDPAGATISIGLPVAMYTVDLLPLWRRFFRDCGFRVVLSEETNRRIVNLGNEAIVAEPCFPIIVAHGHVADLVQRGVDYIFIPNIVSTESKVRLAEGNLCPWGQTLPFVIRQSPALNGRADRVLCPMVRFHNGMEHAGRPLVDMVCRLGVSRKVAKRAFAAGVAAQLAFRSAYQQAGQEALDMLIEANEPGMVLVGRPYNVHDAGVSLSTARKLRDNYGVNVLPIDALQDGDIDITDINDNMFWEYGRRILAVSKLVATHPNLHIIYITNFKCGPDSFIKGFVREASGGKPFLSLQFDGHSNDAGMMTRCEAYLDSKGILRWWRKQESKQEDQSSKAEPSTSPKWLTPVPGSSLPLSDQSESKRPPLQTPTPEH
jgi:predicted nucleotide-binding protein (sugar kinase/HSP70/actin superfamily)